MKNVFRCLFFVAAMASYALAGTVYYVDATRGNDGNNGRSQTSAWKTIDKVNDQNFLPGDTVLFKRGEVWRDILSVRTSGTSGNPITFSAYGSGDLPLINGADLVSGWSKNPALGDVWQASLPTEPSQVLFDGKKGIKRNVGAPLTFERAWYWESNILYVYSASDPDTAYTNPGIEAADRDSCIDINNRSHLIFDRFHCRLNNDFYKGAIRIELASSNITIQNCKVDYATRGISIGARTPGPFTIKGNNVSHCTNVGIKIVGTTCTSDHPGFISHNDVSYTDRDGINCEGNYWIIERNTVHDIAPNDQNRQGIQLCAAVGEGNGQHNIIRYNTVYNVNNSGDSGDGAGINLDLNADNNKVFYNIVYHCDGPGIFVYGSQGHKIYNNVCYGNGQGSGTYHKVEIGLSAPSEGEKPANVSIKNNLLFSTVSGGWAIEVSPFTNITGLVIDYNCYYRASGDWWKWGSSRGDTLVSWRSTSSQGAHDINKNPNLVNPSGLDFMLKASSPCIDAGTDVSLRRDFAGNTVPSGGGVDIGAFEYVSGLSLYAEISASPTSGQAPLTVNFAGSSTGGISPYSYKWTFGDGGSSTAKNPSHTYSSAGVYKVTLTVTDSVNNQASDSVDITVTSGTRTQNLSLSAATGEPSPGMGGTTNPSPGTHSYSYGESISVRAVPNTNYRFSRWKGNVLAADVYDERITVIMDRDKSLSANFCTKCGDANGNLEITAADAQVAFEIYLNRIPNPSQCQNENADVDCNGTITPRDAQAIFNKFLRKAELPGDCSGKTRAMAAGIASPEEEVSTTLLLVEDVRVNPNGYVFVPIIIDNPADLDAFGFDLAFPSGVLTFIALESTELTQNYEQLDGNVISSSAMIQGSTSSRFLDRRDPSRITNKPDVDLTESNILRIGGYEIESDRSPTYGVLVTLVFRATKTFKDPIPLSIIAKYDDIQNATVIDGTIRPFVNPPIREKDKQARKIKKY